MRGDSKGRSSQSVEVGNFAVRGVVFPTVRELVKGASDGVQRMEMCAHL